MKIHRIKTVLLHTWFHMTHSMETWVDLVFNSIIQMIVFSFISMSLQENGIDQSGNIMIVGMLFWNVLWIAQYSICVSALWEIWSQSFGTIFISPLLLSEFLIGQMISSSIKALFSFILMSIVAWGIFGYISISLGFLGLISFVELLMFGWGVGMIVLSLIFIKGTDIQSFSWFLVFIIQPIGGIFYSINILPIYVRIISYCLPTTYIFDVLHASSNGTHRDVTDLIAPGIISIGWLIIGYISVSISFHTSKKTGMLARMLT